MGRLLPDDGFVPFIQTDAAVNPAIPAARCSIRMGEVVGINSQIYSRTGGYQGVSFRHPHRRGAEGQGPDRRHRPRQPCAPRCGRAGGQPGVCRFLQARIDLRARWSPVWRPGTAADKAGLKTGDVITGVNGQPIIASGDLPAVIGQAAPGEKVTLQIIRQANASSST